MPNNNGQSNYRRGVAPLVVLSLLRQGDMYGYQIVQETEQRSGGMMTTQEGSLYPVLYRLEEQGYISSRPVLTGRRMIRVYYHLEQAGEEHLQALIKDYETVTQGVMRVVEFGRSQLK